MARVETVHLGEATAHRVTFQPGFCWSEHVEPGVGTDLCEIRHTGYVVAGCAGIRMADGAERALVAGDAFDIPAGHDMWVNGDEPFVAVDFTTTPAAPRPLHASTADPRQHEMP